MSRYLTILAVLEEHVSGAEGLCICGGHLGIGASFDEHLARQIDAALPAAPTTQPAVPVVPSDGGGL